MDALRREHAHVRDRVSPAFSVYSPPKAISIKTGGECSLHTAERIELVCFRILGGENTKMHLQLHEILRIDSQKTGCENAHLGRKVSQGRLLASPEIVAAKFRRWSH